MKSNLKINSITSTVDIIMKNNLTSMKEHTLDFNTSKENNLNETNPHKLKGQFSNVMSKKLFLKKFELLNINENSDGNEQDLMIEQCNRIEVHDLDKWLDFNKSRISSNSGFVSESRNPSKNLVNNMGNKINLAFRTPTIRNNILNSIMKEDSIDSYSDKLKENIFSPIIKNNKRHVKILRSSEAVKTNINQELMNEIYFNKIMKNNNKTQEDEQQINDQFNNNLPKKLLNYKNISQNTFNNFKSLRTLMKNHVFVLDSELICKKIHEASTSFNEKLFDYSKELKIIETENKRSIGLEADLMEKYVYISQQIKQKLNIEKQIRMMNYMNNKRILTQKENLGMVRKRYDSFQERLINIQPNKNSLLSPKTNNRKSGNWDAFKIEKNIVDFLKMQKTHEERDKAENDINKMILRCSEEIKMNQNNLNNITLEIKELKFRKTHIQLELKDLYFKFLKEKDEKYKNESLTWIIKAFWKINMDISPNDLPHVLDKISIVFLFELANLEIELENLKNLKRNYTFSQKTNTLYLQSQTLNKTKTTFFSSSKNNIRNKLKLLTSNLHQVALTQNSILKRKLINSENDDTSEMFNKEFTLQESTDYPLEKEPKIELVAEASIDSKMKSIKNEIETLKEKEINRLTHSFLENNLDQNNIKALTNIFEYLFGVKESLRLITNILNDKREIKIERNIPKTNRSMSDGNTVKSGILLSIDKMNKNNELKIAISGFKAKKNMFSSNEDVNFKYNLLYNKAPGLQNLYPDSTFLKYNLKK